MFLFSINSKGTIILHPDAIKLCNELAILDQEEVRLIILSYDYFSKFRQLSEDERKRRAKAEVFGAKEGDPFNKPRVQRAIECYLSLQYDVLREEGIILREKIGVVNEQIRAEKSPEEIMPLIKTNKELRNRLNEIESEILVKEEKEINIQGKGKLSLLEKLQRNRERYLEITKTRTEPSGIPRNERRSEEKTSNVLSKSSRPVRDSGVR